MSSKSCRTFLLPRKGLAGLVERPPGKLTPHLVLEEDSAGCVLLDTVDRALLARDGLLVQTDDGLELVTRDGATPVQPGGAGPLDDLPPGCSLCPLAQGQMQRGQLEIADGQGTTLAQLRRVTVGARTALLVTLQRSKGHRKASEALRHRLADCGARPLTGDRLCDLLLPDLPPVTAEVDVPAGASVREGATAILAAHLPLLTTHRSGILGDLDPESLHQYRVALRKMRLVVALFRSAWPPEVAAGLKARLAGLMRPTGAQRDLDVLLADRPGLEALVPPAMLPGLRGLFALIEAEREVAHRALVAQLGSPGHAADIAEITRLMTGRPGHGKAADRRFRAQARALVQDRQRAMRQVDADASDAALHKLRLRIKSLRYLMDFLGQESRSLRRLQELLGRFNDLGVQQLRLRGLLARHPEADPATVQSVGALIGVLQDQAQALRAEVFAALKAAA